MFKFFLDDLFFIFEGSTRSFHDLMEEINNIHPNIKFTYQHTTPESETDRCGCSSKTFIPYLDTSVSIHKGKIDVDLYKKPTDRNLYLLPSSCHPSSCVENIPFSLAFVQILKIEIND